MATNRKTHPARKKRKPKSTNPNPFIDVRQMSDENLIVARFFFLPDYSGNDHNLHDALTAEMAKRKLLVPGQIQLGKFEPLPHLVGNHAALDVPRKNVGFPNDPPQSIRERLIEWFLEGNDGTMEEDFFRAVLRIKYNRRANTYKYLPEPEVAGA